MKEITAKDIVNKINEERMGYFTIKMLINRLKHSGVELPEPTTNHEDIVFDKKIRTRLQIKIDDLKQVLQALDNCALNGPEMEKKVVMW